ncbi:hypothetical protein DRO29_01155 [Candidatus Bathyarchaeota archaeon]|nr:MAG: hypothetical protein DRO29_01155 [Candidatus Bathyarchaeota archaeon]
MGKVPIAYIEIGVFAHATEDEEKVLEAARALIPKEHLENVTFKKRRLKGDYGNPITFFKTKIRDIQVIEGIVENLSLNLSQADKERVLREFDLRLDRGSLYIRLDKQSALKKNLRLCRSDPLHIKIRFKAKKTQKVAEICRQIGIIP